MMRIPVKVDSDSGGKLDSDSGQFGHPIIQSESGCGLFNQVFGLGQGFIAFAHRTALEHEGISAVNEAVEDSIGERWIADEVMPFVESILAPTRSNVRCTSRSAGDYGLRSGCTLSVRRD